ncbi:MAG: hypothetical protein COW24_01465 [Candidatus Kerfeldbacteria bacterium CG15_BIG_FIL_POST_REV_8_21_14_020_45_12]|uniref:M23ase beta-sheet core domain-containing protein n=1 Tax=Candidatus Kerfeldbacteria bacterium CG15_BIG_FIL_POST_REV_8_21_14_020_45_12 TaxID=2014247 RepID=A0A2M7H4P1_9BACT|nr:MAG: hypothetical protein COW24_01465 [Candidatus Kerfeldbacteria bacterium CG15_BIG_FIL_POST_REV_8_21_14_020_45_12]PJA92953.1 MAG: hypothetical protein CO132_05360 [Candidatus Kerfeldbacteria bacterium CG_4_9_14_3_um_filter_45_8]
MPKLKTALSFISATLLIGGWAFFSANVAQARVDDAVFEQIVQTEIGKDSRIQSINEDIQTRANDVRELEERRDAYQKNIEDIQQQQLDLESQLDLLDQRINETQTGIKSAEIELDVLQLEIESLKIQIQISENDINRNKEELGNLIRELYQSDHRTALEITFQKNKTFSDFFSDVQYTNHIQSKVQTTLDTVQITQATLKEKRSEMKQKKAEVNVTKHDLENEQKDLEDDESYKNQLLDESELNEDKFQELYNQVRTEQQQVEGEISSLQGNVQAKIESIRQGVIDKLQDDDTTNDADVSEGEQDFLNGGPTNFSWPVSGRYVTCGFHCADYPFRRIFEHNAIDIDQPQGSPVYASASGYVTIAKFDGTSNYAYLRIDHGNGLSTVYGHISCIRVSVDQFVTRGEAVACSGGLPQTPGAGAYSTGDHLHFEVRVNGIPDDPLKYLPAS